jgi:hypothetical protein
MDEEGTTIDIFVNEIAQPFIDKEREADKPFPYMVFNDQYFFFSDETRQVKGDFDVAVMPSVISEIFKRHGSIRAYPVHPAILEDLVKMGGYAGRILQHKIEDDSIYVYHQFKTGDGKIIMPEHNTLQ